MKIVLVVIGNFQSYVIDNIRQLIVTNNRDIDVICDQKFSCHFKDQEVNLFDIESIDTDYLQLNRVESTTFRNGFWKYTSYRFTLLLKYMKKTGITNIVHIENDVLLYCELSQSLFHTSSKILLTMDHPNRCIPGIMVIPTENMLEKCLGLFDLKLNDMENWAKCYNHFDFVDSLPIFTSSDHFEKYNAIFDAAAIGQYLGGVDPRNASGDTKGFVNETCVIKYNNYRFIWKENKPFIVIDEVFYPVLNLHIHCKDLKQFIMHN